MSATVALEKKRFTCNDYHAMIEAGIIGAEDKLELLNGELIYKSPIVPLHNSTVARIDALLHKLIGRESIIFTQGPLAVGVSSEPEPDLAIVKQREDFYASAHPTPEDTYFVIEVADSTLNKDRIVKGAIYAEAAIPVYWIINLPERQLEVYEQPSDGKYRLQRIFLPGEEVDIPFFGRKVDVGALMPGN